ncbi:hypothetical protein LTT02_13530 [Mycolicibacterium smegmatis]|uniref:hypothetical protein n=1 Tax=Mycolicibacterium smegmatis TaxID=1772 RepID=UPI0005D825AB|nr:hypothetical protein [Mycolicibacterium smegmatis]MDF1902768.1 hypothetical protein [Mycolicibacterium smegmatis]MDF1909044.1 hypothetical protein [Mycolicibacterium smegmatis]MDF1921263.1 hypothetical protein [Mycolicibacterium smegmatis]MDF1927528.1 hypothetical protein [Mycolicibacterium smegmatis]UAK53382.1 hypothetical protein K8P01_22600 [Mycolicibacterium smegmatis]
MSNDDERRRTVESIAEEVENAPDEDDDQSLPEHVPVSRPGHARSKVLQVRLNPDEYEAVERIARRRGLPASTVARAWLLEKAAEESDDDASVEHLLLLLDTATAKLRQIQTRPGSLAGRSPSST